MLSRLAAKLRPADREARARAGIYLELSGETSVATEYYEKAGPGFKEKLDALFE